MLVLRHQQEHHPCDVLTEAELRSFGDYGDSETGIGGKNVKRCKWFNHTTEPNQTTVKPQLNIAIHHRSRFNLENLEQGERTGTTATGRPFKEMQYDNYCDLAMPVFEKPSRKQTGVLRISLFTPDPKDSCPTARKMADVVAPKLY